MTKKDFEILASKIKKTELPGIEAQFKLAPLMRRKLGKVINFEERKPRRAAVMALVFPDDLGEMHMIFMLRKTYKGVHSNQIGFPGGKVEPDDISMLDTALRETYEEIGVKREEIIVLKTLTEVYIPPSNFLVQPYLGMLSEKPNYILEEHEVEELIEIPVRKILNDKHVSSKEIDTSYAKKIEVPVFSFNDNVIWGATAMMLSEIKELFIATNY